MLRAVEVLASLQKRQSRLSSCSLKTNVFSSPLGLSLSLRNFSSAPKKPKNVDQILKDVAKIISASQAGVTKAGRKGKTSKPLTMEELEKRVGRGDVYSDLLEEAKPTPEELDAIIKGQDKEAASGEKELLAEEEEEGEEGELDEAELAKFEEEGYDDEEEGEDGAPKNKEPVTLETIAKLRKVSDPITEEEIGKIMDPELYKLYRTSRQPGVEPMDINDMAQLNIPDVIASKEMDEAEWDPKLIRWAEESYASHLDDLTKTIYAEVDAEKIVAKKKEKFKKRIIKLKQFKNAKRKENRAKQVQANPALAEKYNGRSKYVPPSHQEGFGNYFPTILAKVPYDSPHFPLVYNYARLLHMNGTWKQSEKEYMMERLVSVMLDEKAPKKLFRSVPEWMLDPTVPGPFGEISAEDALKETEKDEEPPINLLYTNQEGFPTVESASPRPRAEPPKK